MHSWVVIGPHPSTSCVSFILLILYKWRETVYADLFYEDIISFQKGYILINVFPPHCNHLRVAPQAASSVYGFCCQMYWAIKAFTENSRQWAGNFKRFITNQTEKEREGKYLLPLPFQEAVFLYTSLHSTTQLLTCTEVPFRNILV